MTYWDAVQFIALAFVSVLLWILTWSGLTTWKDRGFKEPWEYGVWLIVAVAAVLVTAAAVVV